MLRPSYSELMELLNDDRDLDSQITSRYTIVIAAAKRARQIVSGAPCEPDPEHKTDKAVSLAVDELGRGLIKLYPDGLPNSIAFAKRELEQQKNARFAKPEPEVAIEPDEDEEELSMESYVFEPDDYGDFEDEAALEEVAEEAAEVAVKETEE